MKLSIWNTILKLELVRYEGSDAGRLWNIVGVYRFMNQR